MPNLMIVQKIHYINSVALFEFWLTIRVAVFENYCKDSFLPTFNCQFNIFDQDSLPC